MANKTRAEIKKPDLILTTLQRGITWVRNNGRTSILIGAVIVCLGLAVWGLSAYQASKDDKARYTLSQGIRNFEEYGVAGTGDGLSKAEENFRSLVKESPAGIKDVAKLYLARIAIVKGKTDEAKALYTEVAKKPSNELVKKLADTGLKGMDKK